MPLQLPDGIVINVGSDEYCGVVMHCRNCDDWSWTWHPKPDEQELLATADWHLLNCVTLLRGLA